MPRPKTVDPHTAFLYAPHTVSCMLLGIGLLAYFAGVCDVGEQSTRSQQQYSNAAAGVWAAVCVFLGYSVVQGPQTSMVRPHPAVWRLVHGITMVYMLGLVWLLFQTRDDARAFLRHLSPGLGVEVHYRDYSTACALRDPSQWLGISWSNMRSTLFDEFVLAHCLGWWAKALLIRNTTLLWAYSIGFELLEATFAHMLPNFQECWWDSWLLDVAICNSLGIYLGMATVRWLDFRYTNYNWQGLSELQTLQQKATRSFAQFLPYSWAKLDWMAFSGPGRCLQSAVVVAACLAVEVNVFFLKYALWIPPTDWINTARLVLWGFIGAPAIREYYDFVQGSTEAEIITLTGGRKVQFYKLGTFAWMALALIAVETMVSIKFGRGLYPAPWPAPVLISWAVCLTVSGSLLLVWQVKSMQRPGIDALAPGRDPNSEVESSGKKLS